MLSAFLLLGALSSSLVAVAAQDADMTIIRTRLQASYEITDNVTGADEDIATFLPLITPPGIFSDLNYTTGEASNWGGYEHCLRMASLGAVYVTNTSRFFHAPAVHDALLGPTSGVLTWFLAVQPQNPSNWWYQMIGCGRPVAQLSTQFSPSFSPAQAANASTIMYRAQWVSFTRTGTNAADIALVHIGNGLLTGNKSYVAEAFDVIWSTTTYSNSPLPATPEGPKLDGSYMQHGAQLYNGNYGASWTKDALSNIVLAAGTTFQSPPSAYGVVTRVILDGCANMIHWPSAQWDVAVIGRQITNPGGQAVTGQGLVGDSGLLDPALLRRAGGPRGGELVALAAALEDPSHSPPMPPAFHPFPATDFAVQTRPGYYASVRMISGKTAGGECINDQGKRALHAADGVTYWMKSGHEYDNIAPTWDWELLPGTTVQRGGTPLTCATANGMGSGNFTGALRLSPSNTTGMAFMDFNTTRFGQNLRAKKAYFFMEGVVLMLGVGVLSAPGSTVTTTLDSRLLDGQVMVSKDAGASFSPVGKGNFSYPLKGGGERMGGVATTTTGTTPASPPQPLLLVAHGGSGFAVLPSTASSSPPPTTALLLADDVTGAWADVGTYSQGNQTNPMFTLWLDHGAAPGEGSSSSSGGGGGGGGSYAYAVWPDMPESTFTAGGFRPALAQYTIWENSEQVQAVFDTQAATMAAALYGGSTLTLPPALAPATTLTPPFPCAVSVNALANGTTPVLSITYAAPGFLVTEAKSYIWDFVLGGPTLALVPCTWPSCPGAVPMPKGYNGTQWAKWDCLGNNTVRVHGSPTQLDMGPGLAPTIACAMLTK